MKNKCLYIKPFRFFRFLVFVYSLLEDDVHMVDTTMEVILSYNLKYVLYI